MSNKIIPVILQLPFILIVITSFFASIYAVIWKIGGISWAVPIVFGIVIILYFYGRYLGNKFRRDYY